MYVCVTVMFEILDPFALADLCKVQAELIYHGIWVKVMTVRRCITLYIGQSLQCRLSSPVDEWSVMFARR